jgi:hypothetical protein
MRHVWRLLLRAGRWCVRADLPGSDACSAGTTCDGNVARRGTVHRVLNDVHLFPRWRLRCV